MGTRIAVVPSGTCRRFPEFEVVTDGIVKATAMGDVQAELGAHGRVATVTSSPADPRPGSVRAHPLCHPAG